MAGTEDEERRKKKQRTRSEETVRIGETRTREDVARQHKKYGRRHASGGLLSADQGPRKRHRNMGMLALPAPELEAPAEEDPDLAGPLIGGGPPPSAAATINAHTDAQYGMEDSVATKRVAEDVNPMPLEGSGGSYRMKREMLDEAVTGYFDAPEMPTIAEEPDVPTMAHASTNVPISAMGSAPADDVQDPLQAGGDDFLDLDNDSAHARGSQMLHDMGNLAHEAPDMPDAYHLTASTGRSEDALADHTHDHAIRGSDQKEDDQDRDDYSSTRVDYGDDSPPISVRSIPSLGDTMRSDISSLYKDPGTMPAGKRLVDTTKVEPSLMGGLHPMGGIMRIRQDVTPDPRKTMLPGSGGVPHTPLPVPGNLPLLQDPKMPALEHPRGLGGSFVPKTGDLPEPQLPVPRGMPLLQDPNMPALEHPRGPGGSFVPKMGNLPDPQLPVPTGMPGLEDPRGDPAVRGRGGVAVPRVGNIPGAQLPVPTDLPGLEDPRGPPAVRGRGGVPVPRVGNLPGAQEPFGLVPRAVGARGGALGGGAGGAAAPGGGAGAPSGGAGGAAVIPPGMPALQPPGPSAPMHPHGPSQQPVPLVGGIPGAQPSGSGIPSAAMVSAMASNDQARLDAMMRSVVGHMGLYAFRLQYPNYVFRDGRGPPVATALGYDPNYVAPGGGGGSGAPVAAPVAPSAPVNPPPSMPARPGSPGNWSTAPRGLAPRAGLGPRGFIPHPHIPFSPPTKPTPTPKVKIPTIPGGGGAGGFEPPVKPPKPKPIPPVVKPTPPQPIAGTISGRVSARKPDPPPPVPPINPPINPRTITRRVTPNPPHVVIPPTPVPGPPGPPVRPPGPPPPGPPGPPPGGVPVPMDIDYPPNPNPVPQPRPRPPGPPGGGGGPPGGGGGGPPGPGPVGPPGGGGRPVPPQRGPVPFGMPAGAQQAHAAHQAHTAQQGPSHAQQGPPIVNFGGSGGRGPPGAPGAAGGGGGGSSGGGYGPRAPIIVAPPKKKERKGAAAKKKPASGKRKQTGVTQARKQYTAKRKQKLAQLRSAKAAKIKEFNSKTKKMPKAQRDKARREFKAKVNKQFKSISDKFPTARGITDIGRLQALIRQADSIRA